LDAGAEALGTSLIKNAPPLMQVRRLRLQRAAEEFEDLAIVSRMIQVGPKLSHLYHGTQDVNLRKFRHRLENDLGPALRV